MSVHSPQQYCALPSSTFATFLTRTSVTFLFSSAIMKLNIFLSALLASSSAVALVMPREALAASNGLALDDLAKRGKTIRSAEPVLEARGKTIRSAEPLEARGKTIRARGKTIRSEKRGKTIRSAEPIEARGKTIRARGKTIRARGKTIRSEKRGKTIRSAEPIEARGKTIRSIE
jgi:hypothetical protein